MHLTCFTCSMRETRHYFIFYEGNQFLLLNVNKGYMLKIDTHITFSYIKIFGCHCRSHVYEKNYQVLPKKTTTTKPKHPPPHQQTISYCIIMQCCRGYFMPFKVHIDLMNFFFRITDAQFVWDRFNMSCKLRELFWSHFVPRLSVKKLLTFLPSSKPLGQFQVNLAT